MPQFTVTTYKGFQVFDPNPTAGGAAKDQANLKLGADKLEALETGKADKIASANEGNLVAQDATGGLADAGYTTAELLNRANHTGTQSADTLTDGSSKGAFLITERTKLSGIATGATANATDSYLLARANHTGTQSADTITDGTANKAYTATEKTKLAGIATGATQNATDAQLRDRSTHTGVQPISSVTNLQTSLDGKASLSGATFTGTINGTTANFDHYDANSITIYGGAISMNGGTLDYVGTINMGSGGTGGQGIDLAGGGLSNVANVSFKQDCGISGLNYISLQGGSGYGGSLDMANGNIASVYSLVGTGDFSYIQGFYSIYADVEMGAPTWRGGEVISTHLHDGSGNFQLVPEGLTLWGGDITLNMDSSIYLTEGGGIAFATNSGGGLNLGNGPIVGVSNINVADVPWDVYGINSGGSYNVPIHTGGGNLDLAGGNINGLNALTLADNGFITNSGWGTNGQNLSLGGGVINGVTGVTLSDDSYISTGDWLASNNVVINGNLTVNGASLNVTNVIGSSVEVTQTTGFVLHSPNGNAWSVYVDDFGVLTVAGTGA